MPQNSNQAKAASNIQPTMVNQVAELLGELPDKPTSQPVQPSTVARPLKEVVAQLFEPIQGALAKGYTHQEIVDLMKQHGFSTTAETLKSYLNRTRRQSAPKLAKVTKQTTSSKSPQGTPTTKSKPTKADSLAKPAQVDVEMAPTLAKAESTPPAPKQKSTVSAKTKKQTPATSRKSAAKVAPTTKTTARKSAAKVAPTTKTTARKRKTM